MPDKNKHRDEIYSSNLRAGNRTYFFDVRQTNNSTFYITITESKKRTGDDGSPIYEKHKIFLYKEDFKNFVEILQETINKVGQLKNNAPADPKQDTSPVKGSTNYQDKPQASPSSYTDIRFEDLG